MAFWSAISRATGAVKDAMLDGAMEEEHDKPSSKLKDNVKELEARCSEYQKLLTQQSNEFDEQRSSL